MSWWTYVGIDFCKNDLRGRPDLGEADLVWDGRQRQWSGGLCPPDQRHIPGHHCRSEVPRNKIRCRASYGEHGVVGLVGEGGGGADLM